MGREPLAFAPGEVLGRLAALGRRAVVCVHQAELGAPGALPAGVLLVLGAIGVVEPLRQRIPACEEHGCELLPRCPFAADFAHGDRSGSRRPKGGRKFRVPDATLAYAESPGRLREMLPAHPVARWLAERFAARSEWTRFELAEAWLAAALEATGLRRSKDSATEAPDFEGSRRELAACLALLVGCGYLVWTREGLALRLVEPWW
ncbi:MAG: hypothetical protein RMK01_09070 [Thermomicrobium sp.]|nr:hypothetical protein [Thermomicrobium sp.]